MKLIKYWTFIFAALIFVACSPANTLQLTSTVTSTVTSTATSTNTAPSLTSALTPTSNPPTETPLPTNTITPTQPTCSVPISPSEKAVAPAKGPYDFQWTTFGGATTYEVAIGPSGWYPTRFTVTGTILTRYMEIFPQGAATYEWTITPLDASGQAICQAGPYPFSMSSDQQATPSFSDSNVLPVVDNTQQAQNENQPSSNQVADVVPRPVIKLISIEEPDACFLNVTFSVIAKNVPFSYSVTRYSFDSNFHTYDDPSYSGANLDPISQAQFPNPNTYFSSFYFRNLVVIGGVTINAGDTIYVIARVVEGPSGGAVVDSDRYQHVMQYSCNPP